MSYCRNIGISPLQVGEEMLFAFLFCCKRVLNHWVGGPRWQHPKEEQGCMDTHPFVIYTGVGTRGFIPHWQCYVQGRGAGLLPGAVVGVIPWGPMSGRGGQAEGRVRLSLGARRMQMAAGLSGRCWSPLVSRRAACSGRAREPQDRRRIGCLQRRDGLVIKPEHLLLSPGRKR